jgi:hypothetical protein
MEILQKTDAHYDTSTMKNHEVHEEKIKTKQMVLRSDILYDEFCEAK